MLLCQRLEKRGIRTDAWGVDNIHIHEASVRHLLSR